MAQGAYCAPESGISHFIQQPLPQGANQPFEATYHLTRLLDAHPSAAEHSATLEMVFTEYERARIPRSTMLIDTARKQGDNRVIEGVEACLTRNQQVCAFISNADVMAMYSELYGDLVEEGHTIMGKCIPSTGESRVGLARQRVISPRAHVTARKTEHHSTVFSTDVHFLTITRNAEIRTVSKDRRCTVSMI